jgi:hypothetical protein
MKNFNLCLIALIFGSFIFTHSPCHANTISSNIKPSSSLIEIVPDNDDGIDPDWKILITHVHNSIVVNNSKG